MTLNDLGGHVPELELESGEVTTVGGYITQQLGRFPEAGESVEILGYEARVTSSDGRRVGQVHFRKQIAEDATYSIEIMKPLPKTLACVFSIAAIPAGSLTAGEKKNIVDTAVAAGSF
jgi:hypothetical protein